MNRTLWLARILGLGGVLEALVALGLLVDPSALALFLLRAPLAGPGIVIARLAGGGLLALGIACWSARHTPSSPAGRGVSWGFLAYNVVACFTLAGTYATLADGGLPALGASVLHGALGAGLLGGLLERRRSPDAA